MAEKQCRHCAMMIPKKAKICPHCRKRQGISLIKVILFPFLLIFIIAIFIQILDTAGLLPSKKTTYTKEQKEAAQKYQSLLIKSGLIKEMKPEGKLKIVYVNRFFWNLNTFEQKKKILEGLSTSNEIQGYTPWVEIRDHISGEVYAAIKPPLTFEVYK